MTQEEILTCFCTGVVPPKKVDIFWALAAKIARALPPGDALRIQDVPLELWLNYYRSSPTHAAHMHTSHLSFVRAIAAVAAASSAIESVQR